MSGATVTRLSQSVQGPVKKKKGESSEHCYQGRSLHSCFYGDVACCDSPLFAVKQRSDRSVRGQAHQVKSRKNSWGKTNWVTSFKSISNQ